MRGPLRDRIEDELQTAQLRKSFDDNRSSQFEEKLQCEEKECFRTLKAEELQHDALVTDLMDQNAVAQRKLEPHMPAGGIGPVLVSELQSPSPPQSGAQSSVAAVQGVQSTGHFVFPTPDRVHKDFEVSVGSLDL